VKQTGEDKRLTDYLLGNLPEPEETRLEEEYLAHPEAQDRLLIAEDELVDAYLQGELSARERKQLEDRFLASPRGRRKLGLAKSLMALAQVQKPAQAQTSKPPLLFSMRWAFAAALLLLIVVVWSVKQKMWSPTPERAGRQQNQVDHQTPPVAQASPAPSPAEKPGEHPPAAAIASIMLRPVGRNVDQSQVVNIARGAQRLKVQLNLDADNHKNYKAVLVGPADEVQWSNRRLKSESTSSGRAVVLSLPAELLGKGEHTVLLSPDEDAAKPIAEYTFVVQRK
jgi:hypothetical protein